MNIIELAKDAGLTESTLEGFLTKFADLVRAEVLAEPINQEPVGWMFRGHFHEFEPELDKGVTPVYEAPVYARDIRAEALEEAAKHLAESGLIGSNDCAAAIRSLK